MKRDYLSPSSILLFQRDVQEWCLKYMLDGVPSIEQTIPMAIGSAFDAYVKSFLATRLWAKSDSRQAEYAFDTLFQAQVEPARRDVALVDGLEAFNFYKDSGALGYLVSTIITTCPDPSTQMYMESSLRGRIDSIDIDLLGKPDLYWSLTPSSSDVRPPTVVIDWKVNGFYSKTSPKGGYVRIFNNSTCRTTSTRGLTKAPIIVNGIECNGLGSLAADWQTQLIIYGWLLGVPVGTPFVAGIDQIVGPRASRCAIHRVKIGAEMQLELKEVINTMVHMIKTGEGLPDYGIVDRLIDSGNLKSREFMLRL